MSALCGLGIPSIILYKRGDNTDYLKSQDFLKKYYNIQQDYVAHSYLKKMRFERLVKMINVIIDQLILRAVEKVGYFLSCHQVDYDLNYFDEIQRLTN